MSHVVLLGNFTQDFLLEPCLARTFENLHHTVTRVQERPGCWDAIRLLCSQSPSPIISRPSISLVVWVRNGGLDPRANGLDRTHDYLLRNDIPLIGLHLDRYFGLSRESVLTTDPFFRSVDMLFTADGGHSAEWSQLGITHHWFEPAIPSHHAILGTPRSEWACDVAFVGNRNYPHADVWPHRRDLVDWLSSTYGDRFRCFPGSGPQIRGRDLADLYASVKVAVGDSCMPEPSSYYWSDRLPYSVGMGAYSLHPFTPGLSQSYFPNLHLDIWHLNDWHELKAHIDHALDDPSYRMKIALDGHEHAAFLHTYERRLVQVLATVGISEEQQTNKGTT